METVSALLAICAGNSPVPGELPAQRPVTRGFDVFFDLRPKNGWVNNREAGDLRRASHPLWRHRNWYTAVNHYHAVGGWGKPQQKTNYSAY